MDKLAYVMVVLMALSAIPAALPQEDPTAHITATIQTVISISIEGGFNWGNISKNSHNVVPPSPYDNYWVRVEDTTNVRVDIKAKIDNSTYNMAGLVCAKTTGDNQIENVGWWSGPNCTGTWLNLGSTSLQNVTWMADLGPPSPGAPIERYAYPALSTSGTQVAGTYGGTLTVQGVEG